MIHQAQAGDVILQVSLLCLHIANFRCNVTQLPRHRLQWLQEHITRLWIHLPTSCLDEASLQLFHISHLRVKEVSAMPQVIRIFLELWGNRWTHRQSSTVFRGRRLHVLRWRHRRVLRWRRRRLCTICTSLTVSFREAWPHDMASGQTQNGVRCVSRCRMPNRRATAMT